MATEQKVKDVLGTLKKIFPKRDGTQQWDFQKMHGAFKIVKVQPYCLGRGDRTNSSHGKHMHQWFLTKLGCQTK